MTAVSCSATASRAAPDLVLEVVNGSGIGESDANPNGNFDADKYKNVMGRVSQDIGDSLRIGAFGYIGKELGSTGLVNSHVDGRRRRHLDLAHAGAEPAVRGAAR